MSGLGSTWDEKEHREHLRADTRPPREVFHLHAANYAAKVAAETIRADPPRAADLRDDALIEQLALCGSPPRPSEVPMVREAFLAEYGHEQRAHDGEDMPG